MRFMRICTLCAFLFKTAYVSTYTNKSKHLYFKTDCGVSDHHFTWMNTHNLFSKSLIRLGGTLELTFHMSICVFSACLQFFWGRLPLGIKLTPDQLLRFPWTLCGIRLQMRHMIVEGRWHHSSHLNINGGKVDLINQLPLPALPSVYDWGRVA